MSGNWSLKSATLCPVGIFGMLYAISHKLEGSFRWRAHTEPQAQVAAMLSRAVPAIAAGEVAIEAFASFSGALLNKALADRGCSIRVREFNAPDIGAVCFFGADVEWKITGVPTNTFWIAENRNLPGATAKEVILYCNGPEHDAELMIAEIPCKGHDEVFMIPYHGDEQLRGLDLLEFVASALKDREKYVISEGSLNYPLAHLKHQPNLSWMVGMNPLDKNGLADGVLAEVQQENSIEITHYGARVRSATVGTVTRSSAKNLSGPYVFVLINKGMLEFVALCAPDSWRDPAKNTPLELKDEVSAEQFETIAPVISEAYTQPVPQLADPTQIVVPEPVVIEPPVRPAYGKPALPVTPKKKAFIAFID